MKKRIISIMALALVMTGCSFNLPGQEAETDESLESLLEEDADSSEAIGTSANIDTKSSGALVPMPTIVRPMMKLEILARCAMATDESTR